MTKHWQRVSEGTWVGTYRFHGNTINMLVIDLGDGKLAVLSPGPDTDDTAFAELDTLGKIVALVSPSAYHNEGMPSWHARYPDAKLLATQSGIARIAKLYPSLPAIEPASNLAALSGGSVVTYETPGKHGDLLVFVTRGADVAVFSCEYLVNWTDGPSKFVFRLIFKWTDSAPGVRLAKPTSWFLGANLEAVARFCLEKIESHGATAFVPCHGAVIQGADTKARLEEALRARLKALAGAHCSRRSTRCRNAARSTPSAAFQVSVRAAISHMRSRRKLR